MKECSQALNSLKYFREQAGEYHVIAAGSLLGTLLAQPKSYPVGMVNLLDLYPLTFDEFLDATDEPLFRCQQYKDPAMVLKTQNELVEIYENDFSKYNGRVNSGRILMVLRSIVSQP